MPDTRHEPTPLEFPVLPGKTAIERARIILDVVSKSSGNLRCVVKAGVQVPGLTDEEVATLAGEYEQWTAESIRFAFPIPGQLISDPAFKTSFETLP